MTETLHIQLLGAFDVRYGARPVAGLHAARLQSLLAYLLLHRHAPQSRQFLAFLFWPDSTEAQARTNLRNLLHLLRRALPEADRFLTTESQTVQWRLDAPFTLDVEGLQKALTEGNEAKRAGNPTAEREALQKAVDLYRGDLVPSCYDDWILPERERLRQAFLDALGRLVSLLETERAYRAAIEVAQRMLHYDPLHEDAYRALMRLHALSDDRAGALRVYHTCATVLQRELDVEPSPATREAYERLLRAETLPKPPPTPSTALTVHSPLVGRHREWAQLQAIWQRAASSAPHLALIAGEAGIGKTRLAEELARWVSQQGMAALVARCYLSAGELAYAPAVSWLRARPLPVLEPVWLTELARLLPELLTAHPDLPRPGPLNETWQRQRLFEALARAILADGQPLLLVLDDVQWCDQGTREWLHYLLRFDARAALLVVATLRLEELPDDHPLVPWLQALRHDEQLTEIVLTRLGEADTLVLATGVAGQDLDRDLASCVYLETEGNPLFIVELVRAGLQAAGRELACPPQDLPPRIQGAIEARLAQLSPPARQLAGLAATIGREFTYPVLSQACDLDQDALIRGLDELWQRRIVHEQGTNAYDFTHDKLRQVAYGGLSEAHRRLLHGRVAQALESLHTANPYPVNAQIAAHFDRAGQQARAIPHYLCAGQVARQVYANEEAESHYRRALALLETSDLGEAGKQWQLEALRELGRVYFRVARLQEAEARFREAIALGREVGLAARELSRLYYWLGEVFYWQHRFEEQIGAGREGLALLGDDDESVEAALANQNIAVGYVNLGDERAFREFTLRTARFLEHLPYSEELLSAYSHVFRVRVLDKDVRGAMEWLRTFESKADRRGDLRGVAVVSSFTANLLHEQGDLSGSLARREQAEHLLAQVGDATMLGGRAFYRGLTFLALGELTKTEDSARQTIAIASQLGIARYIPAAYWLLGAALLCKGATVEAIDALEQALLACKELGDDQAAAASTHLLGRAYLSQGQPAEALGRFRDALGLQWGLISRREPALNFASALSGLEEAYRDHQAFRAHCLRVQAQGGELLQSAPSQWYLESAGPVALNHALLLADDFADALSVDWMWQDPLGDCSYEVREGLEIHAANGRDLWYVNWSAPRVVRILSSLLDVAAGLATDQDFGIQVACRPISQDKPAMGGLLLWVDERNYLRLDRGTLGLGEVTFLGCLDNQDIVIGRGHLPPYTDHSEGQGAGVCQRVHLRLEQRQGRIAALCSLDGERWFAVGYASMSVTTSTRIGVYAIANIDRSIRHGAYPNGTAIHFESFQVWT